jgi:holo-[acyl-carrier protein] synthase
MTSHTTPPLPAAWLASQRLRVGIDTVQISAIRSSLASFGERFERRLFTDQERAAAHAGGADPAERLAARFAAKEAAIKAFGLSEVGVNWRQIEVLREPDGHPRLALHGRAADCARAHGDFEAVVSLSHDGDQACAIVVALAGDRPLRSSSESKHSHD